jgi:phosphoribosylanthranilate isomerase
MTGPQIKICGVKTTAVLDAALAARADYVGLVFFARSPRHVEPAQAAALAAHAAGRTRLVGLFVDPSLELLAETLTRVKLDAIQLHGRESPEQVAAVAARHGVEVWKALGVKTRADCAMADRYAGAAARVLFDAKPPEGADLPGGNGLRIDWTVLKGLRPALPWMLAGGLDPDNVAQAIAVTGAPAVDVSSGVETAPGIKDAAKIAAFCKAARGA